MSRKEILRQRAKGAVPYAGFLILVLLAVVTGGENFTSMRNIRNILTQSSILMVISVGTTFVILSVGVGSFLPVCLPQKDSSPPWNSE